MITLYKKASQKQKILSLLQKKEWVHLPEILRMWIANHTARISQLRKDGYNIECDKYWNKKTREYNSKYKLHV